jgi:hypothetical protein
MGFFFLQFGLEAINLSSGLSPLLQFGLEAIDLGASRLSFLQFSLEPLVFGLRLFKGIGKSLHL